MEICIRRHWEKWWVSLESVHFDHLPIIRALMMEAVHPSYTLALSLDGAVTQEKLVFTLL
jgi:hypothetical protein